MSNQRLRLDPLLLETARIADRVVDAWPPRRRPRPERPEREIEACTEHVRNHRGALVTACMPEGVWDQGTPQRTLLRSVDALLFADTPPNRLRFVYLGRAARRIAAELVRRRDSTSME